MGALPPGIAIGIERLLSKERARIGRTGRVVAAENILGQSRPVLVRTGDGLMRAGTSSP